MAQLLLANPRKRRATKRKTVARKSPARCLSTTRTVTTKRYRRNPTKKLGGMVNTIKKGAVGAGGAIAADLMLSKLPLPAQMQSGMGKTAAKLLAGVGVGFIAGKLGQRALGNELAQGAVTIAMHDAIKGMVGPSIGLSGVDDGLLGYDFDDLGYFNPSQTYADFDDSSVTMSGDYDMGYFEEDDDY